MSGFSRRSPPVAYCEDCLAGDDVDLLLRFSAYDMSWLFCIRIGPSIGTASSATDPRRGLLAGSASSRKAETLSQTARVEERGEYDGDDRSA
jgi:hypothetical protein